jgi:hypothetical protein
MAVEVSTDVRDHIDEGIIVDIICVEDCSGSWSCSWTIIFTILYNQGNNTYSGEYTRPGKFDGCNLPLSQTSCCVNLVNQSVWLDPKEGNPFIIQSMTITQEYNVGTYESIAGILFGAAFIIVIAVVFIAYRENTVNYQQVN